MRKMNFKYVVLATMVAAVSLSAQGIRGKVNKGNKLYHEEKYEESLSAYRDALLDDPMREEAIFNEGAALYKLKKYDDAILTYEKLLGTEDIQQLAKVYYNIGDAQFQQDKLQEAIKSFKTALDYDPGDYETKYNLELARAKLKEMADKQPQQKQQQKQNQQQNQDQQQQDGQNDQSEQDQNQDEQQQSGEQEQKDQQQQQASEQEQQAQPQDEKKMSKEEAEQILNALKDGEKESQKKKRPVRSNSRHVDKDW